MKSYGLEVPAEVYEALAQEVSIEMQVGPA
jgi:hypothetical protein